MAKDYAKTVVAKSRSPKQSRWRVEYIVIILVLVVGFTLGAYFFYQHAMQKTQAQVDAQSSTQSSPHSWLSKLALLLEHHKKTAALSKTTKTVAMETDHQPPSVHFDFYNELPSMQVTASSLASSNSMHSMPVAPKVVSHPDTEENKPAAAPAIFNADEVSNLLSAETQSVPDAKTKIAAVRPNQQYMIQLGAFETEQGANRLLAALSDVGFQAKIVKGNHSGKPLYHVQQGPYSTFELAKSNQQRLKKRGIDGMIRKIA
jgi:cell division protein FtsN